MDYQIVDAAYVQSKIGEVPIVDVRPRWMYDEGHVPTAKSVELMPLKEEGGDVAAKLAAGVVAQGIETDDSVIVYCHDGGLAREACDLLASQGYAQLLCYEGSWLDWTSCPSRPIES